MLRELGRAITKEKVVCSVGVRSVGKGHTTCGRQKHPSPDAA